MKKKTLLAFFLILATLLCSCGGENQSAEQSAESEAISESMSAESEATSESTSAEQSETSSESAESESSEEEEILYSGTDGNISWEIKGETLTIKGNGAMNDYTYLDPEFTDIKRSPWKELLVKVSKVVIEEGITYIGEDAFAYFHFDEISLPSTLTKIGGGAFWGSSKLKSIDIPDSVTEIASASFAGCLSLESVKFPKSLKKIGATAFECCYALGEINLPEGLEIIEESAFEECYSLSEILIPSTVTVIEDNTFWESNRIKTFKVAEGNENFIVEDGVLFSADKKTLIAFPPDDEREKYVIPEGVERIGGGSFSGCKNLKEIVISNTVKIIGSHVFSNCVFTEITIPTGVEEIGHFAFSKCYELKKIVYPGTVKVLGGSLFNECGAIEKIILSDGIKTISKELLGFEHWVDEITIPASVEKIEADAFSSCRELKAITFEGTEEEWNEIEKEKNWFPDDSWKSIIKFSK